jgi:hypothetical protein
MASASRCGQACDQVSAQRWAAVLASMPAIQTGRLQLCTLDDHQIRRYIPDWRGQRFRSRPARTLLSSAQQLSLFGVTVRPKSGQHTQGCAGHWHDRVRRADGPQQGGPPSVPRL